MHKFFVVVPFLLLLINLPTTAQARVQACARQEPSVSDLPDKPGSKAATPPKMQVEDPASKVHLKVADKKFWILAGLQVGASVADFETTQWAQRVHPDGGELNPLYGRHPGRARMYSIGMSLDAVQILMQYRAKGKAQETGKMKKAWIVGALLNTGVHTFLAVHNGQIAGEGPPACQPAGLCR